jgi:hypothetical protein
VFDLRLNKEITYRDHLFRVLEPTVEFITGSSSIIAAREAAGANMDNDPEVLKVAIQSALEHTEYRKDGAWTALTEEERKLIPVGLLREIQGAFMALQDGLSVQALERQEEAARLLLKRPDAPQEVRDWLENFLPSEADEAPKAIKPEPRIEDSGR